jgi:hypothetical protein
VLLLKFRESRKTPTAVHFMVVCFSMMIDKPECMTMFWSLAMREKIAEANGRLIV